MKSEEHEFGTAELSANELREMASWFLLGVESIRDGFGRTIDFKDNETLPDSVSIQKVLNDLVASVDATVSELDLATQMLEDEFIRQQKRGKSNPILEDFFERESPPQPDENNKPISEKPPSFAPGIDLTSSQEKEGEHSSLQEDVWLNLADHDFSYTKPVSIRMGTLLFENLRTWSGAYVTILKKLSQESPEQFRKFLDSPILMKRRSRHKGMVRPQRVPGGYVETNYSAATIAGLLVQASGFFALEGSPQVIVRKR